MGHASWGTVVTSRRTDQASHMTNPLSRSWSWAALHAAPVSALVLALMAYWFGVADRYTVFLYYHAMPPFFPDTAPFSPITSGRYWMTGFVASGAVLVLYTLALFAIGRLRSGYRPPAWARVWLLCMGVLAPGILLLTMTANTPVLPLVNAMHVAAATVVALALALWPGEVAASAPRRLLAIAVEGASIAAMVMGLSFLDRASELLQRGNRYGVLFVLAGVVTGVVLLSALTLLRRRGRRTAPPLVFVLCAGLCWSYLLLPLAHHLVGTDGWFYITTADNFFPQIWLLLPIAWLLAALIASGLRRFS